MNLPTIDTIKPTSKVILRIDADLPMKDGKILDNSRLIKSIPTIEKLLENGCKIAIIGHLDRPGGKIVKEMSLKPVYMELMTLLEKVGGAENHIFLNNFEDKKIIEKAYIENSIIFFENLRFWKGEEENDSQFIMNLVESSDVFVNDAFAVAHRVCASMMLYKLLPAFYGINFIQEAEGIGKAIENPARPMVIILGGAKSDKLNYLKDLAKTMDYVLIGGKLPDLMDSEMYKFAGDNSNIIVGNFNLTGFDLDDETIQKFIKIISYSKTIIWAGSMGMYEIEEGKKGTNEIAKAIASMDAYSIVAGGDTLASLANLGIQDKFDFICSGGGVMLEYLTKKTLPAWQDVVNT